MECRDAQFYLRFRRPGSDELGPEVAADLDRHLAGCEHCAAEAWAASAFDAAVAAAVRDVPVPAGLRTKLIAHVAEKRGADLRRQTYRYAGAAAAVFLALGMALGLFAGRPTLQTSELAASLNDQVEDPRAAITKWLAAHGASKLPEDFDPALLGPAGFEKVRGESVPFVEFRERGGRGSARVFALRRGGPFNLKDLRDFQESNWQARVYDDEREFRGVVFVVVFTGPDLRPFLRANTGNPNL